MTASAALHRQLADEHTAKQRQYVRSNTRARWSFVGIAVTLLAGARVAGTRPEPRRLRPAHRAAPGEWRVGLDAVPGGIARPRPVLRRAGADADEDRAAPAGDPRGAGADRAG